MTGRQLRARVLLEEARALGLDLDDLIAADTARSVPFPTVRTYLEAIAPTFTPATAATYRPYWRLLAAHLGEHRLGEVTIVDLASVVEAAAERATRRRPTSTGRASRETCVAALRAVFRRAVDAGLITANPAAALTKPRRAPAAAGPSTTGSSTSYSTPCAPPATTPTWISSSSGSTSGLAPAVRAP